MAGIYIHVPFCKTRCLYCDFYSTVNTLLRQRYVDALCLELRMRHDYLKGELVKTVYLGGGTPTQLEPQQLVAIFDTLREVYGLEQVQEVTLEANPDDLTEEYVAFIRTLPINRLSIGVQTFDDKMLRLLQRRHTAQEARDAVRRCRKAGLKNISIDLIYGLPGQTEEMLLTDLETAFELYPQHLSTYHLTYEKGTPLYRLRQSGNVKEVSEEQSRRLYRVLTDTMKARNYVHYEISNFCRGSHYSRHNMGYWTGVPYLGCGPSAHSFDVVSREWNRPSLKDYVEGMEKGERPFEKETLTLSMRYNEYVMTGLRTLRGISLTKVAKEYGAHRLRYLFSMAAPHMQRGMLVRRNGCLRLTEEAFFVSDDIISDLMYVR